MNTGAFWTWVLDFYRRDGISPALIALQDREGLDVNALLLCAWLADTRRAMTSELAAITERAARDWSGSISGPVRAARRALKTTDLIDEATRTDIRKRVHEIELALEELHVGILESAAHLAEPAAGSRGAELASANARRYLAARQTTAADITRIIESPEWHTIASAIGR